MTKSDEDLVVATARGDREAFGELYRRLRPAVYRFAVHMTGSTAVAEDVVQETFLAVIRAAARYQPGRSGVTAWLLGIARNHALRRAQDRRAAPLPGDEGTPGLWIEAGQHAGIERDEEVARLRTALAALPVAYREAVVLCELHELSYADAAAALGCAVGTVRSRLHRGRAMLAERMLRRDGPRTRRMVGWIT